MKASILVPTYNAGPGFEELLQRLLAQETRFDYEILVLDSGSTDGTAERALRYGARVHRIACEDFDHGASRNLGISICRGDYIALIVQDALPVDRLWLSAMVENLEEDLSVAGVYGRQAPRLESGPLTRVVVNDWPTGGPTAFERREQVAKSPEVYKALSRAERRALATFDNVSSCLRRSVWEEIPFERTRFGEDLRWGKRVIEAGYKLVFEPRSAVLHSHERGALYDLRRYYVDQRVLLELFGISPAPNLPSLAVGLLGSSARLFFRLRREEGVAPPRAAALAARQALCSQAGAYLGAKSRPLAKTSPKLFARLDAFLSKGI